MDNAFSELLVQIKKADAVICATNALSVSGLVCAKKNNIRIPDDIAFIGFDGGECFDLFHSPLTYVKAAPRGDGKRGFPCITRFN